MPEPVFDDIQSYIAELKARAGKSQAEARRNLNPLFLRKGRDKGPDDFVESSFLYIRSCDADQGSRPIPCPVFWLSPDLKVAPVSNLGAPTRQLTAGETYRLSASVRNRGDLMVPSAKVEFWLVTPSLGFDTRFATKIGVVAGRVMPFSSAEMSLDYTLPPSLSGHRCLFARVFSFAPLDIPVDDHALNPVIDRHVGQLNLDIAAQGSAFVLQWVHHQNARERLEIAALDAAALHSLRREELTPLTILTPRQAGITIAALASRIGIEVHLPKVEGVKVTAKRTKLGIDLSSENPKAVPIDRQVGLAKEVQAALIQMESGKRPGSEAKQLFADYRAMTAQTVKSELQLKLPDLRLKTDQAIALNLIRRDVTTNTVTGGVALVVVGKDRT